MIKPPKTGKEPPSLDRVGTPALRNRHADGGTQKSARCQPIGNGHFSAEPSPSRLAPRKNRFLPPAAGPARFFPPLGLQSASNGIQNGSRRHLAVPLQGPPHGGALGGRLAEDIKTFTPDHRNVTRKKRNLLATNSYRRVAPESFSGNIAQNRWEATG